MKRRNETEGERVEEQGKNQQERQTYITAPSTTRIGDAEFYLDKDQPGGPSHRGVALERPGQQNRYVPVVRAPLLRHSASQRF